MTAEDVQQEMQREDAAAEWRPETVEERREWWMRCATQAYLRAQAYAETGDIDRAMRWARYALACETRAEDAA